MTECRNVIVTPLLVFANGFHVHLQEAVKSFEEMSVEDPQDLGICTLATGCVNAGDLLMIPPAFLLT